jgi:uncharacterized membrane protein (GlpM family)
MESAMQLVVKLAISLTVILVATGIGKRWPAAAGLIGVMPLTGALVLVWLYLENKGNPEVMQSFARGALWGIVPSVLFFLVAFLCFKRQAPLSVVLAASFGVWVAGAAVHQWLLK